MFYMWSLFQVIFFKLVIWRDIKESILERNVLHVIIVSSNFFKLVICRDMKESVMERNVLHVMIVSSNLNFELEHELQV